MDLESLVNLGNSFYKKLNISEKEVKLKKIEAEMNKDDFWEREDSQNLSKEFNLLKKEIEEVKNIISDGETLLAMNKEIDEEEIKQEINDFEQRIEKIKTYLLFDNKYDYKDAIIKISAGNGGSDAEDWTAMLYRMYIRYFENQNWKIQVIEESPSDDGMKSVMIEVKGDLVFGKIRRENGVHRLIRLSPFKSNSSRQTSFALVEITPVIEKDTEIEIRSEDLEVKTARSSGAGGQHVNKTESAVRIVHIPTGIVAECSSDRSQLMNRETAMKILKGRIAILKEKEHQEKMKSLKGEKMDVSFGSQKRTLTMQPYQLVKDHETNWESGDIEKYLNGDFLEKILYSYL